MAQPLDRNTKEAFTKAGITLGSTVVYDINSGAIDGVTIGAASAGAGTFTTMTATTVDINGGAIDGATIGAASAAAGTFAALISDTLDVASSALAVNSTGAVTAINIDGGTVDGATVGANSASSGAFTTLTAGSGGLSVNSTGIYAFSSTAYDAIPTSDPTSKGAIYLNSTGQLLVSAGA